MKSMILKIIHEPLHVEAVKGRRVYENCYLTELYDVQINEVIQQLIMNIIRDGVKTEVYECASEIYVDVILLKREYDLDEIIRAINLRFVEFQGEDTYVEQSDDLIFITCDKSLLQEEDIVGKKIRKFIDKNELETAVVSKCTEFEFGCGSWFYQGVVLMGITLASTLAVQEVVEQLKRWVQMDKEFKDYVKVGTINIKQLRLNLAYHLKDKNVYKYPVTLCEKLEDGTYSVDIRKKYITYRIKCNESGEISEIILL